MVQKHSTIVEAYEILGLEQGVTLEVVKSTYKQLALKTHPDKNPGNEEATAQFQRISEAYNVLLKHLDTSSSPPRRHTHGRPFNPFGSYDQPYDDYDDDDDEYDDDEYEYYDSDDDDEDLLFYMFLFEEAMRGKASRFANARYHHHNCTCHQEPESPEEYQARLRRAREEQEEAEVRRAQQDAARKAAQEREREIERQEAEARQKVKASTKKAQAEASRKTAANKARAQLGRSQTLRSNVFAAARRGEDESVKKGVWEDGVDASGGEVKKGAEAFVKNAPQDPLETLLHIYAKRGEANLVEWLDTHSADPEERDSNDFTPFHAALQGAHIPVLNFFFETHPIEDSEGIYKSPSSKSILRIALETGTPEIVWTVLNRGLATEEDVLSAWDFIRSEEAKKRIPATKGTKKNQEFVDELTSIIQSFGKFSSPPSEPSVDEGTAQTSSSSSKHELPPIDTTMNSSGHPNATRAPPYRQRNGRSRNPHYEHPRTPVTPQSTSTPVSAGPQTNGGRPGQTFPNGRGRSRGRGRGRGWGTPRGRGRGGPPP